MYNVGVVGLALTVEYDLHAIVAFHSNTIIICINFLAYIIILVRTPHVADLFDIICSLHPTPTAAPQPPPRNFYIKAVEKKRKWYS